MITEEGLSLPPEMLARTERYAVYRCFSERGELLYVGSGNLGRRIAEHAQKVWFLEVRGITVEWYADELDARLAERRAIHVEHPKHNVLHRNTQPRNPKPKAARTRMANGSSVAERAATLLPQARKINASWQRANGKNISAADLCKQLHVSKTTACEVLRQLR